MVREIPRNAKVPTAEVRLPQPDEHFNEHFRRLGWGATPKRSPLLSPGNGGQALVPHVQQLMAPPAIPQRRRSPQGNLV